MARRPTPPWWTTCLPAVLVAAVLVPAGAAQDRVLPWRGELFDLSDQGTILGRRLPVGPPPAVEAREWRVRVHVVRRLEVGTERADLDAAACAAVRRAFAGFAREVRDLTRGLVRIELDVSERAEPLRVDAAALAATNLAPTQDAPLGMPGAGVESVFLVFPAGTLDLPMLGGTLGGDAGPDGAATTGLAFVAGRAAELPRAILHEWCHQVEWLARARYGMAWLPSSHDRADLGLGDEPAALAAVLRDYLSPVFWRTARMRGRAQVPRRAPGLTTWDSVADDPWRRLPLLRAADLAALAGRAGLAVRARPGRVVVEGAGPAPAGPEPALDHVLDLGREAVAVVRRAAPAGGCLVLCRPDVAGLFGARLRGAQRTGVAGVVLPLRPVRSRGVWSAGGSAAPLAVFVTDVEPPGTELELLGSGAVFLSRGPAVAGTPLRLEVRGGAAFLVDGLPCDGGLVPPRPGALLVDVPIPDADPLRYVVPVRPPVTADLRPRSGPAAVVRQGAHFVLEVRGLADRRQTFAPVPRMPPGWELRGLPATVEVAPGEVLRLACQVHGPAPAAAPQRITLGVDLVPPGGAAVVGVRRDVHAALGRTFVALDFEDGEAAVRPGPPAAAGIAVDLPAAAGPGGWSAAIRRGGRGAFLRIEDGGGARFGRHYLLAPSAVSYDTKVFPCLEFAVRLSAGAAPAAINVQVGDAAVSLMLRGKFRRAWDARRELPRAEGLAGDTWHRVRYDLDAALDEVLGPGVHRVSAIDVGDPRAWCSNAYRGPGAAHVDIDDFAVVR